MVLVLLLCKSRKERADSNGGSRGGLRELVLEGRLRKPRPRPFPGLFLLSHRPHPCVLCFLLISMCVIGSKKYVCASDLHVMACSLTPLHGGSMCKMMPMVYALYGEVSAGRGVI